MRRDAMKNLSDGKILNIENQWSLGALDKLVRLG